MRWTHRPFAAVALTYLLTILWIAPQLLRGAEVDRPNILFVFADDWGRFAGAYAPLDAPGGLNDVVQTEHFDRIAHQGVLFRNAFVNAPSCTPCRSSLLSGQYFWRTGRGAILQGARWDTRLAAWPLLLDKAGYHLGKTGKVWSPGVPVDAPYGGQEFAYEKAGKRFNQFSQQATKLVDQGKSVDDAKQELLADVRENFANFLTAHRAGQPFCYWFGPTNVHRKWVKGSGKALWGIDPDSLQGRLPPFLPDVPAVREDLADYFGEIAAFDAALGVLLSELQRSGEMEKTLIVVSGDHGAPGFPHGKCNLYDFGTRVCLAIAGPGVQGDRVVDDFVNLPDLAPTFLEAGGVPVPDEMTARSLWPVLKSTATGLVDPQRTFVITGRERHVAKARDQYQPYPQRALRTQDYLLVINFRPERYPLGDPYHLDDDRSLSVDELANNTFITLPDEDSGPTKSWLVSHRRDSQWKPFYDRAYGRRPREELFDLRKDPNQMNNVASDPGYETILTELRTQLLAELERTSDPRMVDDGAYFENPPLAGPVVEGS